MEQLYLQPCPNQPHARMPLPKPLSDLQQELRAQLVDDLAGALKALQAHLPPGSDKCQTATMLLGKLNDTNKARLRGTISNEALQLAYNQLRSDLLDLIDGLAAADFEAASPTPPEVAKAKRGEILYRIPNTMPLGRETRCLVRIALDADAIVENITLDEHVVLKALSRVSDLMQVELLDPGSTPAFEVRSINSAEQFVEAEGYTEWLFQVMPLRTGTFPLLIKVSVIELILGKERKKEIVLEETVQVSAEAQTPTEVPLKSAGEKLVFGGSEHPTRSTDKEAEYAGTYPEAAIEDAEDFDPPIPKSMPAPAAPPMPAPARPGTATGGGRRRPSTIYTPPPQAELPSQSPPPRAKKQQSCLVLLIGVVLVALVCLVWLRQCILL